jgi:hypothetical protein
MKMTRDSVFLLLLVALPISPASAQGCDSNCSKIKEFIAVAGATMEGCGKAFPERRAQFLSAFKNWKLLEYRIPGLEDLLSERTPELRKARAYVASDFANAPKEEQDIQCSGYGGALANQELFLPPEMLAGYGHGP